MQVASASSTLVYRVAGRARGLSRHFAARDSNTRHHFVSSYPFSDPRSYGEAVTEESLYRYVPRSFRMAFLVFRPHGASFKLHGANMPC